MGDRQTYKDLFFGVTNITHPEGHLFLVEDGTWSSKWSDQFASSHDRGPMSLRAFKKYLRKHPELEVFGNVMSLCSRYRGLASLSNPEPNSDGMYEFDCHIDAIYVPAERKGFPEHTKSVKAFVRMNRAIINDLIFVSLKILYQILISILTISSMYLVKFSTGSSYDWFNSNTI